MRNWSAAALVSSILVLGGCSPKPGHAPVVVIGIDAATLDVVLPFVEAGRMPHLASLLERGSYGELQVAPPLKSPVLWTTLATGQPPTVHGIQGFYQNADSSGERIFANSTFRQAPALWNIASHYERDVSVVGWWVTWPAEPVRGSIISDHFAYTRLDEQERLTDSTRTLDTFPSELRGRLEDHIQRPQDFDPEEVAWMGEFLPEEIERMRSAVAKQGESFGILRLAWQQDITYLGAALDLLDSEGQPDLMLLFFRGTDSVGHHFWHLFDTNTATDADPAEAARLADVIPNYYQAVDGFLGQVLEALDPNSNVIVISDHGMTGSGATDPGGRPRPGIHTRRGMYAASGPNIAPAGASQPRDALSVAPTVLHLLGVPLADDMEDSWEDLLVNVSDPEEDRVETHAAVPYGTSSITESSVDPAMLEQLKALGYVDQNEREVPQPIGQ